MPNGFGLCQMLEGWMNFESLSATIPAFTPIIPEIATTSIGDRHASTDCDYCTGQARPSGMSVLSKDMIIAHGFSGATSVRRRWTMFATSYFVRSTWTA